MIIRHCSYSREAKIIINTSSSFFFLQRKSLVDERLSTGNGEAEADSSGPEEDDKEVNLDNFMTLDSVGDVDGKLTISNLSI